MDIWEEEQEKFHSREEIEPDYNDLKDEKVEFKRIDYNNPEEYIMPPGYDQ